MREAWIAGGNRGAWDAIEVGMFRNAVRVCVDHLHFRRGHCGVASSALHRNEGRVEEEASLLDGGTGRLGHACTDSYQPHTYSDVYRSVCGADAGDDDLSHGG